MYRGYTTPTAVAQELGVDLTGPQLDQCADLLAQAEDWIDRFTGRKWLVTSTTSELHTVVGPVVYLNNKPVTAITSITLRPFSTGAPPVALAVNTDYELLDPANGLITILPAWDFLIVNHGRESSAGYLLSVSYTSTMPVPGDIQRAATLITAHWMLPRLNPERQGVSSYSLAQVVQVSLRPEDMPEEALRIVRAREALVFA